MSEAESQSSSKVYVKVANFTGLYRHVKTGRYYAMKKINGKRKERSLETADRKIAERRFKEWVATFGKVDSEVEKMTLRQPFSDHAQDSADFVEFLGLAGLGQAEASSLTWGDIDWKLNRMRIRRHKTDTVFYVPIYDHLRPLLERLRKGRGAMFLNSRVFKIKDAKKALTSACERLGLPHFSQRNLRQGLIMRLWRAGVDHKLIAKWQGHRDGGQLILDTYTEVFGDDDGDYEKQQLSKIGTTAHAA